MNRLFFGDNLEILKRLYDHNKDGFIDLIYIDPPFNSKRNYNVLFEDIDLDSTKAQKEAFADTWSNVSYVDTLNELKTLNLDLYTVLETFDNVKISKSAVSYLTTMAIRVWYMHKLLKDSGSFYLHCDPTMSHYLKVVCDIIFGSRNFKNEITWQRTNSHNDSKKQFANINDKILFYGKSDKVIFNPQYLEHNEEYVKKAYRFDDNNGLGSYRLDNMAAPAGGGMAAINKTTGKPNGWYVYKGFQPPDKGWRYELSTMERLDREGKIYFPKNIRTGEFDYTKRLALKRYLNEQKGNVIGNNWSDINPLNSKEKESLDYPTQKPEALMERIIKASSNEGDVVADFFCGCGTTIAAAQKLKRKWLGVDISHLAVNLISKRLINTYGEKIKNTYEIAGMPKDLDSAKKLATDDKGRFRFQDWIVEVMLHGVANEKKSADGGWDGYITFDYTEGNKILKDIVLIEVKSGNVNVKNVREFIQVVEKRKSGIGVFVCFGEQVTKPMLLEAKQQGYFREDIAAHSYPKIQIVTVEDLLAGKSVIMPKSTVGTFKTAKRINTSDGQQSAIEF